MISEMIFIVLNVLKDQQQGFMLPCTYFLLSSPVVKEEAIEEL